MDIRNSIGKLVCKIDQSKKIIEIAIKGCTTIIRFCEDGTIKVINIKKAN